MKMKLLFLLLILFSITSFSQINLVANGGFEDWTNNQNLANWTIENNVNQNVIGSAQEINSAELTITSSTNAPKITTQVPMVAGVVYTVKYKFKYLSANYSGQHPISLKIIKDGSATTTTNSSFASNNDWVQKITTFIPDLTTSYDLSISTFTFDGATFEVLIDDVQVYVQGSEQYTLIPDVNFENALIAYGIDSGAPDGKVITYDISSITNLSVTSNSINSLTGIQDFVALKKLICYSNNLSSLDITKNINLTEINCTSNKLISLDVSKNMFLSWLACNLNKLTTLNLASNLSLDYLNCSQNNLSIIDVSNNLNLKKLYSSSNPITNLDLSTNTKLTNLHCSQNKLSTLNVDNNVLLKEIVCSFNNVVGINLSKNLALESLNCQYNYNLTNLDLSKNKALSYLVCGANKLNNLDLSQNTALTYFHCDNGGLSSLNLKNGNNTLLTNRNFLSNPNLKCIQVDDATYSNANWATAKDINTVYSTDCIALGIAESVFDKVSIYPIPSKGELHIDNILLEKATLYDSLGKLVKTTIFTSSSNNSINLSGLPKGIYYVFLQTENASTAKEIIVE
jgi:Leucine-rich repeat (LRR) protein